jgi:hypothetical protein
MEGSPARWSRSREDLLKQVLSEVGKQSSDLAYKSIRSGVSAPFFEEARLADGQGFDTVWLLTI